MVTLKFHSIRDNTYISDVEVFINTFNELVIKIDSKNDYEIVCLDKQTAIKFSKEIRKQISFLED